MTDARTASEEATTALQLILPPAPESLSGPVKAWEEPVTLSTYMPDRPDRNPMFLEKRVYQGSSGRVYPLPFIDRIATEPEPRAWKAIHLENEFVRLMILPEIGGRIHIGYDKVTGYDFFYRQNVIKPALVGLAGPWISGGVEFNWPQHHRPATFMPVETEVEKHPDGSITVWCSDHDPMLRMKGMHGVRLYPGEARVELCVRLYNRTPYTQTFLWWANVATRVHEKYQSFFPTDVRYVADHAKRAVTSFPQSDGSYYGVDYAGRERDGVPADEKPANFVPDGSYPANDLSWYANIPVPTSYMITKTKEDFFGGYDHAREAGVVHVANHHISPGKKQWTWGNHDFGYAWDRNLTESDGPYIELMAGVYTDNQPDFSYLAPWETKSFRQSWYPIHGIGIPQMANTHAALSLHLEKGKLRIGLGVTHATPAVAVVIQKNGAEWKRWSGDLSVETPLVLTEEIGDASGADFSVTVEAAGKQLIAYDPASVTPAAAPVVAREPLAPEEITTVEELYLTGIHLTQYRHATRQPELYWKEALRRDPGESRVLNALGLWRLRRGEFAQAVECFERAIARLTTLNPNPYDGEAYYNLGIALRFLAEDSKAYDALYKATWNAAWRGPAYFALAEIDSKKRDWEKALDHVQRSLLFEAENLNALNLLAYIYEITGEQQKAAEVRERILNIDPLDVAARWAKGLAPHDGQELLDLAFDFLRCGRMEEVEALLKNSDWKVCDGTAPLLAAQLFLVQKTLGRGETVETNQLRVLLPLDYCFPSRLEEFALLERLLAEEPQDESAHHLLGNFLYDRRRYEEAIEHWRKAAARNPHFPTVWRNLGIALYNVRKDADGARAAFDKAFCADPTDARILYERDQLWKRLGDSPQKRLTELQKHPALLASRDDLSVEVATLFNQIGKPQEALNILENRKFQPWEGGEGLVLGQYVRAQILLGREALEKQENEAAIRHFLSALAIPENLSEAKHLLANQSDVYYWLGLAYSRSGKKDEALRWWEKAIRTKGDFQQMSVREVSNMTYWTAQAMHEAGQTVESKELFQRIYDYSIEQEKTTPKIDYFATSLPTMLLFEEDLVYRNRVEALFLRAQASAGLGRRDEAKQLLKMVLQEDANHSGAADLLASL